jgi:hypothetical protein
VSKQSFRLSAAQVNTDLWRGLQVYYEIRLAEQRAKAENIHLDDRARLEHVLRIDEIKRFLALGQPIAEQATDAG